LPKAGGSISGSLVLTDDALNAPAPSYATQSISLSGTGTQATPSITWTAPVSIPYGTALSSAQLDATTPAPGTFTYSPAAGTVLTPGTYTLTATFTPTDATAYTTATASVTLTVNLASVTNVLGSSANPAYVGAAVTFTATVSSTSGMPTGAVSFYDGTTLLGSSTLSSGTATFATSTLAAGSHSITAAYVGNSNFEATTSSALTEVVEDFSIGVAGGGNSTATASPGGQAVYKLAINPPSGDTLAGPVTFTVTGLPQGATAAFSPATIASGAGATNVTLTVTLPASAATTPAAQPFGKGTLPVALGLILLPFAGLRKTRRLNRVAWLMVLCAAGTALAMGITACGGSSSKVSQQQAQSYTLTVTASSGSLSHNISLTLTVE